MIETVRSLYTPGSSPHRPAGVGHSSGYLGLIPSNPGRS